MSTDLQLHEFYVKSEAYKETRATMEKIAKKDITNVPCVCKDPKEHSSVCPYGRPLSQRDPPTIPSHKFRLPTRQRPERYAHEKMQKGSEDQPRDGMGPERQGSRRVLLGFLS